MGALQIYAEENKYYSLSKFETVEEFNSHFEQTMIFHKEKFTKSEYLALNKFRKYAFSKTSKDTIGVAWSKIQTVVAATHKENLFGISRSTFNRMLRKAKKLNLITVINQYEKNNYQKHSVYVFNRFEELTPGAFEEIRIVSKSQTIEAPENAKIETPLTIFLELPRFKELKTFPQADSVAAKETKVIDFKESKTEYQQLNELIDGLFADKRMTSKIYGVWLAQTNKMFTKVPFEICIQALKTLIGEVKRRIAKELKPLKNPAGYFSGILSNKIDEYLNNQEPVEWEYEPQLEGNLDHDWTEQFGGALSN